MLKLLTAVNIYISYTIYMFVMYTITNKYICANCIVQLNVPLQLEETVTMTLEHYVDYVKLKMNYIL